MLVLDTHVWIWLINGDEKIRVSGFLEHIDRAVKKYEIKVSAISLWEVSMLASKGRISFNESTLDWIKRASSAPGISLAHITPEIAYESSFLPGEFHGDPADRLIVATARIFDSTLLTFDEKILEYSKNGYLKTIIPN